MSARKSGGDLNIRLTPKQKYERRYARNGKKGQYPQPKPAKELNHV